MDLQIQAQGLVVLLSTFIEVGSLFQLSLALIVRCNLHILCWLTIPA